METGTIIAIALLLVLILIFIVTGLKIVSEHEQGVIMRLGRFRRVVASGLVLVVPFVDVLRKVDLRTLAIEERIDPMAGTGKVRLWGELWPARGLSGETIGPGTPIMVVALDGQYVVVDRFAGQM